MNLLLGNSHLLTDQQSKNNYEDNQTLEVESNSNHLNLSRVTQCNLKQYTPPKYHRKDSDQCESTNDDSNSTISRSNSNDTRKCKNNTISSNPTNPQIKNNLINQPKIILKQSYGYSIKDAQQFGLIDSQQCNQNLFGVTKNSSINSQTCQPIQTYKAQCTLLKHIKPNQFLNKVNVTSKSDKSTQYDIQTVQAAPQTVAVTPTTTNNHALNILSYFIVFLLIGLVMSLILRKYHSAVQNSVLQQKKCESRHLTNRCSDPNPYLRKICIELELCIKNPPLTPIAILIGEVVDEFVSGAGKINSVALMLALLALEWVKRRGSIKQMSVSAK